MAADDHVAPLGYDLEENTPVSYASTEPRQPPQFADIASKRNLAASLPEQLGFESGRLSGCV